MEDFTNIQLMHLLLQSVAIVLWISVIRRTLYLRVKLKIAIPLIVCSFFVAFNLMAELYINNFREGSSMFLWYPANYILALSYWYFLSIEVQLKRRIKALNEALEIE